MPLAKRLHPRPSSPPAVANKSQKTGAGAHPRTAPAAELAEAIASPPSNKDFDVSEEGVLNSEVCTTGDSLAPSDSTVHVTEGDEPSTGGMVTVESGTSLPSNRETPVTEEGQSSDADAAPIDHAAPFHANFTVAEYVDSCGTGP